MNTNLPPILETKLADFRRRVWVVKLIEGILAALFGLALSYLLVFALDRFIETPAWLRLLILIGGTTQLGLGLPLQWHQWVWRQRRLEDAARLLRRTFPRLGDQLLGLVELARLDHAAGRSERLVQAAMAQAADAVKDQDFRKAVPDARHRQWGWAAGALVGVSILAFLLVHEAARNTFARWLMPWRNVDRYTFTRVDELPSRLVVPLAEPFTFSVRLAEQTKMQPAEASATLGTNPANYAKLSTGSYQFQFPPEKKDTTVSLAIGDVRKTLPVLPRPRPELTQLEVNLRLPEYLRYKSEPKLQAQSGSISIVRGAQASYAIAAGRELASAEMDGQPQKIEPSKFVTEFRPVEANIEHKFTWKDPDGLTPRDPYLLKVQAVDDQAPRIVARRETLEQVVLDSEVLAFDLTAADDFGVKTVGLEWVGTEATKTKGEKIAAAGEPEKKEVMTRATFCATREGVAPQTLELRAWADDYLPDRQRTRSASFILHILDKTEHALWLTEQFGKWLAAARESYEKEQQLHETNKELRQLSPEELDRPENRRRVSQQASAEQANSARLDNLTQIGKKLVEQATKNDEFDAARLESWATMLKALDDISGKRMPTVTDLLKQTAGAPTGKPSPSESKTAPSLSTNNSASKPAPNATTEATPKPPAPSISDTEKSFSGAPSNPNNNSQPKPPGGSSLKLPTTTLGAAPSKDQPPPPPQSPAQEKLDNALANSATYSPSLPKYPINSGKFWPVWKRALSSNGLRPLPKSR